MRFDHCLAVRVFVGIVEVIMVTGGWCFHFQCLWFAVFCNVVRELLDPIVLDIKVDDQKVVSGSGWSSGVEAGWVEGWFLLVGWVLVPCRLVGPGTSKS